jgi:Cu+-exporting ATPase
MQKDPVCGMTITPEQSVGSSVFHGKTYWFCSLECKQKFDEEPELYARRSAGMDG